MLDKIRLGKLDKRVKLSHNDKQEIRERYKLGGVSHNELAREYGVSKRSIQFAISPQKYERVKEQRRQRWAEGMYRHYYDKESHREAMRSIRERKKIIRDSK